jgi:F420 biosynthesis protein FbiB-like protein
METLEAIVTRRSIRKFTDRPVAEETVNAVLAAAILAPSGKNRQPWRFVVVAGDEKRAQMIRVMRKGIADTKARGMETGTAIMTARVMERAPVTIFVFNPEGVHAWTSHSLAQTPSLYFRATLAQTFREAVDIQSIGAAIQNMLLAARAMGLGTLWMCDVWSAYQQLEEWLGESGELIAAVALGYPDEEPAARPRRPLSEVVRWF